MENIGEEIDKIALDKFRELNLSLIESLGPVIDQAENIQQQIIAKTLLDDDPQIKEKLMAVDQIYDLLVKGLIPHCIKLAQLAEKL
jgi:hypothetical protein